VRTHTLIESKAETIRIDRVSFRCPSEFEASDGSAPKIARLLLHQRFQNDLKSGWDSQIASS
jgi:hypothetical protein